MRNNNKKKKKNITSCNGDGDGGNDIVRLILVTFVRQGQRSRNG